MNFAKCINQYKINKVLTKDNEDFTGLLKNNRIYEYEFISNVASPYYLMSIWYYTDETDIDSQEIIYNLKISPSEFNKVFEDIGNMQNLLEWIYGNNEEE